MSRGILKINGRESYHLLRDCYVPSTLHIFNTHINLAKSFYFPHRTEEESEAWGGELSDGKYCGAQCGGIRSQHAL